MLLRKMINPFSHNVEKWLKILLKYCDVNIARFFKYVWPFFNVMHEGVKQRNSFIKLILYLCFTCYNSTTERVEKDMKYVQSCQQRYHNDASDVVLVSLLLTLNMFFTFFYCFSCLLWTSVCLLRSILKVNFSTIFYP